ncbi:glucose/sorbosone dehydrogenase family protein [Oceanococcus atlanticus]|uniref:Glucose/sorbosone dehydrogenase family protein n=1 Tax=Oceanococcus atlanticus TaxID=1317117 RepID=A0A1Y1SCS6_9GAMM|nr:PQQ-dependent sugar dehydrogenase [Oceanococcus atlanticus]ORE86363.1 glucose/sorbosone dehydrogenase family protein [Oceanococcus atlanticus]
MPHLSRYKHMAVLGSLALLSLSSACRSEPSVATEPAPFRAQTLLEDLEQPWALAFLPDQAWLITQKAGELLYVKGKQRIRVAQLPDVAVTGQGGLMDVALHPAFALDGDSNWVYLTFNQAGDDVYGTALGRGRLVVEGNSARLDDWQTLFSLPQKTDSGRHFGSRIAFDDDGHVYFSIGDRGERQRAQDSADAAGSVIRLTLDGGIPEDNPLRNQNNAHPAIYSYGHRNIQGMATHPDSGEIWTHEHGPQGGDELNRIVAGRNYGWPLITYGKEYGTGFSIGEGSEKPGIEPPRHYWVPSIAPSGMAFYRGSAFADWQGDILVGALKHRRLVRLDVEDGRIVGEHRYVAGEDARIRDVRVGPDGLIYVLTDASKGKLIRLAPPA